MHMAASGALPRGNAHPSLELSGPHPPAPILSTPPPPTPVHLDSEGHASFRQMLQSVDPGMGYLPGGAQTMVEPRQSQEGMGMGLNLPMAHGSLLLNQQVTP